MRMYHRTSFDSKDLFKECENKVCLKPFPTEFLLLTIKVLRLDWKSQSGKARGLGGKTGIKKPNIIST